MATLLMCCLTRKTNPALFLYLTSTGLDVPFSFILDKFISQRFGFDLAEGEILHDL